MPISGLSGTWVLHNAEHRCSCYSITVLIRGNIRALAQGLTAAPMQITPQSWLERRLLWENANVTFAREPTPAIRNCKLYLAVGKMKATLQNQGT